MTKKMRVWPNIIIRMTDGSARIGGEADQVADLRQPICAARRPAAPCSRPALREPAQAAAIAWLPGASHAVAPSIGCAPTEPTTP